MFDYFKNYSAHVHHDKATSPSSYTLLPKDEFIVHLRKDVGNINEKNIPTFEDN